MVLTETYFLTTIRIVLSAGFNDCATFEEVGKRFIRWKTELREDRPIVRNDNLKLEV